MVIKRGSNGKNPLYSTCMQHDIPQSLLVFAVYLLHQRRLILGCSVELRTPLDDFLKKILLYNCVYAHI